VAIRSFGTRDTEAFWKGGRVLRFQGFENTAMRKLQMLNAAISLHTLAVIPANRLEPLKGDRKGQHSIRVNDQWRICFVWDQPDACEVEITNHYS
jgi:toxin HigB-1